MKSLAAMLRFKSAPSAVFATVFVLVFFTVLGTSTLVTFLLPKTYASMARIVLSSRTSVGLMGGQGSVGADAQLDPNLVQTEIEIMKSEVILDRVIEDMDLNKVWAKKFAVGNNLRTSETRGILRGVIEVQPIRNTALIEIRAFSENPDEAAALANAVAKVYRQYGNAKFGKALAEQAVRDGFSTPPAIAEVSIVDQAEPALRAMRPNVPLNLFLGAAGGIMVALVAGAVAVGIVLFLKRRMVAQPR